MPSKPRRDPAGSFLEVVARRVADRQRLAAVSEIGLLDTGSETGFDRIASLAAELLATPFGFITVVDETRSFWKAHTGVDSTDPAKRQEPVGESFCQYVIGLDDALAVGDTRLDDRTKHNPSIVSRGVLAWAGVPLRAANGEVLGTVCVADTETRSWTERDTALLYRLADIATGEIRARQTAVIAGRSGALLSAIVETSPTGFCLFDNELRFEMVNQKLAAMNELSVADHLGRTIHEVWPDAARLIVPSLRSVLETGEAIIDVEVVREVPSRPSEQRTWLANYFRVESNDHPIGVGGLFSDVTDRVRSRQRAEKLAHLTYNLVSLDDLSDVVDSVSTDGARYLGADTIAIAVFDPTSDVLDIMTPHVGPQVPAGQIRVSDENPYGQAIRTREPVLIPNPGERAERFPASVLAAEADGYRSSAVMPLFAGGYTIGALAAEWRNDTPLEDFPLTQLRVLSNVVAQTLERCRNNAERQQLVTSLQMTLLSPPPSIAGLQTAVRYLPAGNAIGFGGDWYDVVVIDQYRSAVIVGDISGHDATAAARMSHARTTISNLVQLDTLLKELFTRAEDLMANHQSATFATVSVTVIDTANRTMTSVSAGHPPPLYMSLQGPARPVKHALRSLIGVRTSTPVPIPEPYVPGATLIAYTDGLIETRNSSIDLDIEQLRRFVPQLAELSVEAAADKLLAQYAQPADQPDDIALVVARM